MGSGIASHFVGWQGGILMSLIAFSIVFLVIAGLMLMMMALKVFVAAINKDNDKSPPAPSGGGTAAPPSAPRPPAKPVVTAAVRYEPPASDEDDDLVAVFAAAIADMSGQAAAVLSYAPAETALRRPSLSAWRMAGILSNSRGFRD
ncbi:MAG: OadG family protein [Synergistaceae bacterium]|jgi:Na+-transporting methylmalonyl-CoA/oxaloacetate decarboxylase gamma subunit|nr:OadG family protein [Synergistaceae bacterium]